MLYSKVGSWPYSQTTDKAEKATQGHNISDEEKQFYESLILGFRVMKLLFFFTDIEAKTSGKFSSSSNIWKQGQIHTYKVFLFDKLVRKIYLSETNALPYSIESFMANKKKFCSFGTWDNNTSFTS